jgi:hypothetical protein
MSNEEKQKDAANDPNRELSAEELNLVSGGAVDIFLSLDGITGESSKSGNKKP